MGLYFDIDVKSTYVAKGYLYNNKSPVKLKYIYLINDETKKKTQTFTDEKGFFIANNLEQTSYIGYYYDDANIVKKFRFEVQKKKGNKEEFINIIDIGHIEVK